MKKIKSKLWFIKRWIIWILADTFDKFEIINPEVDKIEIWKTVKWKSINCYKIGNWETKIMMIAWIHGNETGTIKLLSKVTNWLYKDNNFNSISFYIIPCLNLDWFEQARINPDYFNGWKIGRFNANWVDMNRNFDTNCFSSTSTRWFGKKYETNNIVNCGKYWLSEPETRVFSDFIKKENIRIIFSYHNSGKEVMWNLNELSQDLTKMYSSELWYRFFSDEERIKLNQTWTMKKWADENNLTYVEVEGSGRWSSDWRIQKNALKKVFWKNK